MLWPNDITIPHATHLRKLLDKHIIEVFEITLVSLPIGAKISLALDCWTSPNNLSFMAIIEYYIDQDWQYKKALLGFEPLTGVYTGKHLVTVLT